MRSKLISLLLACLIIASCSACSGSPSRRPYSVLLGLDSEDSDLLKNYGTAVIDAQYFTEDEIAAVQSNGTSVYTYLNIGSIETFREGYDSHKQFTLSPYDNWPDEYWMDVSRPEWQSFIANEAQALIAKGVDGFFLDNADVYYFYPSDEIYNGLTAMISALGTYGKPILINGGDIFVTRAVLDANNPLSAVTGVNQECVFTNINFALGTLTLQDKESSRYYQDYLARCKSAGLDVYLTEYASNGSSIRIAIQNYCVKNGFSYYISHSINLDGK